MFARLTASSHASSHEPSSWPRRGVLVQARRTISSPTDDCEREADRVADSIVGYTPASVSIPGGSDVTAGHSIVGCPKGVSGIASLQVRGTPEWTPASAWQLSACAAGPEIRRQEIRSDATGIGEEEQAEEEIPEELAADDVPEGLEPDGSILPARLPGGSLPTVAPKSLVESSAGQPLPAPVRESVEARFGHNFSAVRIHTDDRAAAAANSINSAAFTYGRDIYFGAGRFAPQQPAGLRLLAHELTHVIQQGGGDRDGVMLQALRRPTIHAAPPALNRVVEAHVNLRVPQRVRIYKDAGHKDYETSAGEATTRLINRRLRILGKRVPPTKKVGEWGLQYFSWITTSGIGFHSNICYPTPSRARKVRARKVRARKVLEVDGHPHSHGCMRLHHNDAIHVYDALSINDHVMIYDEAAFRPRSGRSQ